MSGTVNRSPRHAEPVDLVSRGEGSLGSEWDLTPQRMWEKELVWDWERRKSSHSFSVNCFWGFRFQGAEGPANVPLHTEKRTLQLLGMPHFEKTLYTKTSSSGTS